MTSNVQLKVKLADYLTTGTELSSFCRRVNSIPPIPTSEMAKGHYYDFHPDLDYIVVEFDDKLQSIDVHQHYNKKQVLKRTYKYLKANDNSITFQNLAFPNVSIEVHSGFIPKPFFFSKHIRSSIEQATGCVKTVTNGPWGKCHMGLKFERMKM